MMRRILIALCISQAVLYAQTQPPQVTTPITLQEALATARKNNPAMLGLDQHLNAVRAQEVTAGLRQNPNLYSQGTQTNLANNDPNGPPLTSVGVNRLFELGGKRDARLSVARSTTALTASQIADQRRQLDLAVRTAFTRVLVAKSSLAIANDNLMGYRHTVDLMKVRLDAGDVSRTDFDRIDLQLAGFESDFTNAKLNLEQSAEQLQTLLGIAQPTPNFDVVGTLDVPRLAITENDLEQQALANRPDLKAAEDQIRVNDAGIHLAESGRTWDPTIGGEYERSGYANTVGFQLNLPLRIFDRNQGERQRTRYETESSRFALTAARNQVVSDVRQSYAAYLAATELAERYRAHYLDEAAHVRDNLEFSYRNGDGTLLDYLSALQDYRQVNLASINANAQVLFALHQLSFATATEVLP
jgi:cobalt-zinc-cadmium efflux system outer membrane protein